MLLTLSLNVLQMKESHLQFQSDRWVCRFSTSEQKGDSSWKSSVDCPRCKATFFSLSLFLASFFPLLVVFLSYCLLPFCLFSFSVYFPLCSLFSLFLAFPHIFDAFILSFLFLALSLLSSCLLFVFWVLLTSTSAVLAPSLFPSVPNLCQVITLSSLLLWRPNCMTNYLNISSEWTANSARRCARKLWHVKTFCLIVRQRTRHVDACLISCPLLHMKQLFQF